MIIQVRVKPNSPVSAFAQKAGKTWPAQLKSLPVEGKANEELVALIATHFDCRKSAATNKSGASGRMKGVNIDLACVLVVVAPRAVKAASIRLLVRNQVPRKNGSAASSRASGASSGM